MVTEHSAGAILYNENIQKFLLLKRNSDSFWEFPKGHVEEDEEIHETLRREIEEETGIKSIEIGKKVGDLVFTIDKGDLIKKRIIHYFLVRTVEESIRLSEEHSESIWLDHEDVIGHLHYDDIKELFKKIRLKIGSC